MVSRSLSLSISFFRDVFRGVFFVRLCSFWMISWPKRVPQWDHKQFQNVIFLKLRKHVSSCKYNIELEVGPPSSRKLPKYLQIKIKVSFKMPFWSQNWARSTDMYPEGFQNEIKNDDQAFTWMQQVQKFLCGGRPALKKSEFIIAS